MIDGEEEVPRVVAEACLRREYSPMLEHMLKSGLPLTRNAYQMLNWGGDLPEGEDWTGEHEASMPRCFRDPNSPEPSHKKVVDAAETDGSAAG